ncbi:DegT/DnrJ/EryC1/StrS family aminotransferase [Paenibacillus camelliae]|uniref:DegT/DnrJ/EryC1/StrS family aminotransferase n=1 Tax=Paenibacillus camelliae TaxID=512410 RepID=UPI0020415924|nr:DegT/DnrJ/EryC1/StrS family aminotransferase [Paenibacillus camelliae]MCM3633962.1 DegT/DnrJ/EryC1/StrS family aminotransferase [Paenibacillus camelliae]
MKQIAFSPPDITEEEIAEVIDTLRSGWITTGPKTKKFEQQIANYCGTNKAVALNSATACMEMTLRMLGVGPGDEVITSAYTYTASASVIHHVGATIVLVDTEPDSYHLSLEELEKAITDKTKVIIPVDIAGVMCDYDKILDIVESKKHLFKGKNKLQEAFGRIVIMADAAHSFGASYKGRKSGEVADFTSFSFHAVKNLTTAEGGAVTWREISGISDEEIYKQYMLLTLHGQTKDALAKTQMGAWEYDIVSPNYKCNMTDIMASIGIIQLSRYEELLRARKKLINQYVTMLEGTGIDVLKHYTNEYESSGHLLLTRINMIDEIRRNEIITKLASKGISSNVHYKPLPMLTAYKNLGFNINNFPNSYSVFKNELTLPLHTFLTSEDVSYICEEYINALKNSNLTVGVTNGS